MSVTELSENIKIIDAPLSGHSRTLATYLVSGERCAVIDPGPTSQTVGVLDAMRKMNVTKLDWVLATHIHLDHAGGSWMLLNQYPDALLHCHPKGAPHMVDPSKLKAGAERLFGDRILEYGEIKGVEEKRVRDSKDREVIDFGGTSLEVYWTPGHSSHSQCYFEPDSKCVFVGDSAGHTIGAGGPVIPVSPPPHNPEQGLESMALIKSLRPETLCIAHFGAHNEPVKYLNRIIDRTRRWMRLSEAAVREGLNLDGLVGITLEEDDELREHIKDVEGADHSVKASLLGFYLYAKWVNES